MLIVLARYTVFADGIAHVHAAAVREPLALVHQGASGR